MRTVFETECAGERQMTSNRFFPLSGHRRRAEPQRLWLNNKPAQANAVSKAVHGGQAGPGAPSKLFIFFGTSCRRAEFLPRVQVAAAAPSSE